MDDLTKEEWRRRITAYRGGITADERSRKSDAIGRRLAETKAYAGADAIGFYCSFGDEVETAAMMAAAFKSGRRVFLPTINPQTKTMTFSEHDGDFTNLACNFFGIYEPQGPPGDHNALDLIIVPGLAFDRSGWRIGYGIGYYDRFLKTVSAPTIGVCFSVQLVPELPKSSQDVPVDMVITEDETITGTAAKDRQLSSEESGVRSQEK